MGELVEMTFTDHLKEMRTRLIVSVVAILAATLAAFIFSDQLLKLILIPSGGLQLKAFSLIDGFMIKWRVSLYTGIAVAFPIWAYEIYSYIQPALYDEEKRMVFPMLVGSLVLFVLGTAFGYYLLSGMIRVLKQFFPPEVDFLPVADDYINFVVFFLLACGLAFQLPTLIIALVQLRIVNTGLLRKHRKIAYFVLFAFAEIITPVSDPIVAPLTVMGPLLLLYESSLLIGRRIEARRRIGPITMPAQLNKKT